jgi:23S rRNA (uracil1939-C5)-methyltransferase
MDVTIEKLIYGGEGLAHFEGSTVFVPFVLPGEKAEASPVERKKKFVRARMDRVIERSPERIAAPCPHFGICGGCDYQHIPYEGQLQYKIEILRETLRRLGRVEWTGAIKAHASPPWNYRNRAQWKVRPIGERGADERGHANLSSRTAALRESTNGKSELKPMLPQKQNSSANGPGQNASELRAATESESHEPKLGIGYFRANSTALCAVQECAILSPLLHRSFLALREAVAEGMFPKSLREIEAFVNADDSKILLTATFSGFPSRAAELAEKIKSAVPETGSLLFFDPTRERMELFGPGFIEYEALGVKYRVGHLSFFQVNRFLVEDLARTIAESGAGSGGRLALDLFAGVGLFSVPLAKRFERVVAVEANPAAGRDLEANMRAGGAIEVRTADVERFLERYKEKPNLVVLDPPRAGAEPGVIKRLTRIGPERITYVSCEPPTLARDLVLLREGGYEISEIQLFDLFPQTFHMETVVQLKRH